MGPPVSDDSQGTSFQHPGQLPTHSEPSRHIRVRNDILGMTLVVQRLGTPTCIVGGTCSIPGPRTKILHATYMMQPKNLQNKNFCSITRLLVVLSVDGGRLRRGAEMVLAQWFQGSRSPSSEVGERKKLGSAHGSPMAGGTNLITGISTQKSGMYLRCDCNGMSVNWCFRGKKFKKLI